MGIGQFFKKLHKDTQEFLEKEETKTAITKIKTEFGEAKQKISTLMDEGDVILKRKVDSFLNKGKEGKEGETFDADVTTTSDTEQDIHKEADVKVKTAEEETIVIKDAPTVDSTETELKVDLPKAVKPKAEKTIDDLDLTKKIKDILLSTNDFNTVEKLQNATESDLLGISGIGAAAIKKIKDAI